MISYKEDCTDVDIYLFLRKCVGWAALDKQQAQTALNNSLKIVTVFDDEKPIGMGRVVGDGAVISYIQDLIVVPEYQKMHIGSHIIERLKAFVYSMTAQNTNMMLCLMCAKGREEFYKKHGFIARPTDSLGPGMIQYIRKD
ncbi:MAG: GNAT family N-acetyltransferase [Lachnospira sp.]|nr:GNAT family N-acetyltransferase [Lachnospira sp.]